MSGALNNLKVVEMAAIGPVPVCGQLLADQGADVVILDRASGAADTANVHRRNKRSVALNLKSAAGIAAARRLIDEADILLEGFRPGVMERLGLGPTECHESNAKLVYGRMTGWGQSGPLASTAGHDLNYLAITGALQAIGRRGEPPVPPLNLVADYGGGAMFLAFGVLAALFERSQSGRGQVVDAAMSEGVPAMMGLFHSMLAQGRWTVERENNLLDGAAPFYRCYETSDGKYISIGALEPQFFARLAELAGLPEEDCTMRNDKAHWPAMHERYSALFRTRTRAQWTELLADQDCCMAPVLSFDELEEHPQNQARGTFRRVDGVLQAAPAPRFDRTAAPPLCPPQAPGGATEQVLGSLGYTAQQLQQLRVDGVLT